MNSRKLYLIVIAGWIMFLFAMIEILDMRLTIRHQERMLEAKESRIKMAEDHVEWWRNEAYGVLEDLKECKGYE